jgi:hypothetical protein
MRERPINVVLGILAICVLGDLFVAKEPTGPEFMVSMGVFGALVLRTLADEPQPLVLGVLGVTLSGFAIARNHELIDRNSDFWWVISIFAAFLYALWEKIMNWFSY